MKKYIALDIGGTALKYGIVDEQGNILEIFEESVSFDGYETPILNTILKVLDAYLKDTSTFSGICVSATGQIDSKLGKVIGVGGNIKNYLGSEIKKTLEERYHLTTEVLNDANAVAAAEKWIGAGNGYQNVIAITIGTGVGGGIYVHDQLLLGARGIAGEIGHFSIDQNNEACTCGNMGCYERFASMSALVRKVNEKLNVNYNGRMIFERYDDPEINILINEWMDSIAKGIISLVHIFNPEVVIIGGGVSKQDEKFIQPLIKKVADKVMPRFLEDLKIVPAKLENGAGMVGAVYHFRGMYESL